MKRVFSKGSAAFPPLAGYMFNSSLGANSILHLTLAVCLMQCLTFAGMWLLARKKVDAQAESYQLRQQ